LTTVTPGIADPFGGARASEITGGGAEVAQVLAVPGDFQYAVSVWARSVVSTTAMLFGETSGGSNEHTFTVGMAWKRISMPVVLGLATESVKFGVRFFGTVELFGMQVEAQPGAGGYQRTDAKGGVHAMARFDEDALTVRARGADVFDAVIQIVTKGS
jgi:hypothetical protein